MKKILSWRPHFSKKFIIILIIVVLIVASQWFAVRLVYAKKVSQPVAIYLARIYHLQAGKMINNDKTFVIGLLDYLDNINFAKKYLAKQAEQMQTEQMGEFQMPSDEDIYQAAWRKMLKDAWLNDMAKDADLAVSDEDVRAAIEQAGSYEEYKVSIEQDLGINFSLYEKMAIRPSILEAKVYQYLLDNYNDRAGMEKAQAAYEALDKEKRDFIEVAKEYSDDLTYVDQSWFVNADELGEFAEPISDLKPGDYSRIIVAPGSPGAYVILKLISSVTDANSGKEIKEFRGIAIQAKSLEEFFDDFLNSSEVKKWY